MSRKLFVVSIFLALARLPLCAATFTVSNTNTSGAGSLQQAILDANANPGADTIVFNIASGGTTITPANTLPVVTDPVTIDGSTQPGYDSAPLIEISGAAAGTAANGLVIDTSNCVIHALAITGFQGDDYYTGDAIEITNGAGNIIEACYLGMARDGVTPAGNAGAGVRIGDPYYYDYYDYGPIVSNNIIGGESREDRNLISANGVGIYVIDSPGNLIQGNYIGIDLTGAIAEGNTNSGVTLYDSYTACNIVGGTNAGDANLISGNGTEPYEEADGVYCEGGVSNAVYGNFIGVDITGSFAIPNSRHGVNIQYGENNLIGGATPGQRNLISGNNVNGVNLGGVVEDVAYSGTPAPQPYGNIIQGNLIGTDATGLLPLPNGFDGVEILNMEGNLVGGFLPGEGNVIDYNTNDGVEITGYGQGDYNEVAGNIIFSNQNTGVVVNYGAVYCPILSNSIYGNTNLGIDLDGDGVTYNDEGDGDFGANYLQNFPVLGFPLGYATQTVISGTLNSAPDTVYHIELFDSDSPDPTGYGQGERFLGSFSVTNDDTGNSSFVYSNAIPLPTSDWISATATDPDGDTSEFCLSRQVVGPNTVDIEVTLSGSPNPAPKSTPFVYTITVTNNGPGNASGVVATNPLPVGLSFVSAISSQGACTFSNGLLTCDIGLLPAGTGAIITLTVNATNTATITDTVGASANESDNNLLNNTASLSITFGIADLSVSASAMPDPIVAGQTVTYTLLATNLGPDDASDTYLSFYVDPSIVVTGATSSQGMLSPLGSYISCNLGTLPANGMATVTVTGIPTQVGTFYNYASIGALEIDPDSSDNYATVSSTVEAGPGVIQFSSAVYTIDENGGAAVITVVRTGGAIGAVSVHFSTANLTAIAGLDYLATNGTLSFADGVTNQTFLVPIIENGVTDCNKQLSLQLSDPINGVVLAGQTNSIVEIFNDHPVPAGVVQGVSLADTNLVTTGNNPSFTPSISEDGRYVVFASEANNLVSTPNVLNAQEEIYLRDRQTGTNSLVSLDTTGLVAADNYSESPEISGDGQVVAFFSGADNITTNVSFGNAQIFARNLATGANQLVTVNTNGVGGNSSSDSFTVSSNGTKFAFSSYSSDLVPGDTNNTLDIFYRDLTSNSVVLVSVNSAGNGSGDDASENAQISADGRYVAFGSYADNLSPADNNTRFDIYRRDMVAGATALVSANASGFAGNDSCGSQIFISGNGRYVAFESYDTDLAPGAGGYYQQVYLRDMVAGTNQLVSINNSNVEANGYSAVYGLSLDGRYVLFASSGNNLATNDNNNEEDLFLRDVVAGTTALVTVNLAGTAPRQQFI